MLIFFPPRSVSNLKKPGYQRYLAGKCCWIGSIVCSQSDGWARHFADTSNSGTHTAIAVLQDSYRHMEVRNEEAVLWLSPRPQSWCKTEPQPGSLQDLSLVPFLCPHDILLKCPVLHGGRHVDYTAHVRHVSTGMSNNTTLQLKRGKVIYPLTIYHIIFKVI